VSDHVAAFNASLRDIGPEALELAIETALHYRTMVAPALSGETRTRAEEGMLREQAIARLETLEVPTSLALAAVALGRGHQWPTQALDGIVGATQLLAHVHGGRAALDSGFAVLADVLARADSLAPWDSGPLLFMSNPYGLALATDGGIDEGPGARALLCTLARIVPQQSPAGGPDYGYVRSAAAADLLVWLEASDPQWLKAQSDSVVQAWSPSRDVPRLRDRVRENRTYVNQ
jgi:hypothetical protein